MRARLVSLGIVVSVACSGCSANLNALRAYADGHVSIFVSPPVPVPLEPASGLFLVSAQSCSFTTGWGTVLCLPVVAAVDLVALPVQAIRRQGQSRDLDRIAASCLVTDPAVRFANDLADKMIQEFHFSPTPADTPAKRRGAVLLEVRTANFTRSSRIEWEANIVFRSPDGEVLWKGSCAAQSPARDADTFELEHVCEAARAEIAVFADHCVESVVHRIRDAWPSV